MKTLFFNVDTQNDFMRPYGNLYIPDAEKIEPNLYQLTELAEKNDIPVVNTSDWHYEDSEELSDNPDYINTFPVHCMADTWGADFIRATKPDAQTGYLYHNMINDEDYIGEIASNRNIVVYKDEFNVFGPNGNPDIDKVLKILDPSRVIVYGVATNVCVAQAVRGLVERVSQVYVVEDAIKELPDIPMPWDEWKAAGVQLINTDEVETLLND